MTVEVERCQLLGIDDLVVHPGAHMGAGEDAGLSRVAAGLDEVHRRTEGSTVVIDLETTAGQGTCLGHRFEHLGAILDRVGEPERLGRLRGYLPYFRRGLFPWARRRSTMGRSTELDRSVGLGRVRVWHLNDSCRERGSRVDRHAGIGAGRMGLEPFRHLVNDPGSGDPDDPGDAQGDRGRARTSTPATADPPATRPAARRSGSRAILTGDGDRPSSVGDRR